MSIYEYLVSTYGRRTRAIWCCPCKYSCWSSPAEYRITPNGSSVTQCCTSLYGKYSTVSATVLFCTIEYFNIRYSIVCVVMFSLIPLSGLYSAVHYCTLYSALPYASGMICICVSFAHIFYYFTHWKVHQRHCKLSHQSQSQNCAIFTSHIW